ncbi:MAG TPA: H(+)-transporting ATPase [Verrucomicrobiales bacterium]|jgi:F-type H+-transporting ATPase subunit delta|nr:H(+)-transporting ATPase [Verrucomicrobiales bacterium]|tara:strand:- start:9 stop:401 length:393 start_codon:yes stop_codon:yes gene_type:complete
MKGSKQSRRDAKQLFQSCQANGVLDEDRVRQVVALLIEKKPRGYFGTLQELQRLVKLDVNSRSAHVESAVALNDTQQQTVRDGLSRLKGSEVAVEFAQNADLIGGMRVRLGDDVFDGSVRTRLTRLGEKF